MSGKSRKRSGGRSRSIGPPSERNALRGVAPERFGGRGTGRGAGAARVVTIGDVRRLDGSRFVDSCNAPSHAVPGRDAAVEGRRDGINLFSIPLFNLASLTTPRPAPESTATGRVFRQSRYLPGVSQTCKEQLTRHGALRRQRSAGYVPQARMSIFIPTMRPAQVRSRPYTVGVTAQIRGRTGDSHERWRGTSLIRVAKCERHKNMTCAQLASDSSFTRCGFT